MPEFHSTSLTEQADVLLRQAASLLSDARYLEALQAAQAGIAVGVNNADLSNLAGICASLTGDDALAEKYWRQAIAANPAAAQAHFNLGLLLTRQRRVDEAELRYRRSIALEPANADAHTNLGALLEARKQYEQAEQCYRQAIALAPHDAGLHCNLGALLVNRKQYDAAERCFRQAIALAPAYAGAYSNLGITLAACGQHAQAEQCYRQAIALEPANADAYSNLGILLALQKRFAEAEESYRHTIALAPGNATAYANLGLLLQERGRDDAAEYAYRHALALAPESSEIHSNLANLLAHVRREEEAETLYRRAIALNPDAAAAYSNLGVLLSDLHREQEAEQCFTHALALEPRSQQAHYNFGVLLLSQGRFEEGWPHHEFRYENGLTDPMPGTSRPDCPQWQGEPLEGKSLLVFGEQGMGDQMQFCRYLPLMKERGAARITLVCDARLAPLMAMLPGVDTMPSAGADAENNYDYWTFLLSIPIHFKTGLANIPAHLPYLYSSVERDEKWAAQWDESLTRERFLVGLVWRGNVNHSNDANRSLPSLSVLAPLWSIPGVQFVSLQKGAGENEANHPPPTMPLLHVGAQLHDFADTAAAIMQLDLVISVDTAVVHLAGALGKPCWVLLPAHKVDWRWSSRSTESLWYPRCLRLFRQQHDEDWAPVIDAVAQALGETAAHHAPRKQ